MDLHDTFAKFVFCVKCSFCFSDHEEVVKELITSNPEILNKKFDGNLPIHLAAIHSSSNWNSFFRQNREFLHRFEFHEYFYNSIQTKKIWWRFLLKRKPTRSMLKVNPGKHRYCWPLNTIVNYLQNNLKFFDIILIGFFNVEK